MSDKIYDLMDEMNEVANDPLFNRESGYKLSNLKKEYNKERDQEQYEYNLERLKGGNMVDIEDYKTLRDMYDEKLKHLENLEKELKDLEDKVKKLTTDYTNEISNVYMKTVNKAKSWMLFFMGTTIGCLCYIGYLVLYVK